MAVVLLATAAFIASFIFFSLWGKETPPRLPASRPEFADLVGRWVRPDGGYILDIRRVSANGTMEVGYYNPRPIHVARGEATHDSDTIKVFVELRDVNYPGSTYTLHYRAAERMLVGEYIQPLMGQKFDVGFVRE